MSLLSNQRVADVVALGMQGLSGVGFAVVSRAAGVRLREYSATVETITIPTSAVDARASVYRAPGLEGLPPVYVNFHGGGYVMRGMRFDDPLCRYLAVEAGVVVVNVDYAVAPQYRFPIPPHQAYEVVSWAARHGAQHGWDGTRLVVGGQSAGGALAAAVARQALEHGDPPIALQVLHYAPLDLATPAREKHSIIEKPVIRPWMGEVFDNAYIPDPSQRSDRLASPANALDTAELAGIAPAFVITPEYDRLFSDGERYAARLQTAGALVEHYTVLQADHGYDMNDDDKARQTYARIAAHVRRVTHV
jgi:acetyl esterase